MLSIIIKEHRESSENILQMLNQISDLPMEKELLFMTSMPYRDFVEKYQPWNYDYNIGIYDNVMSCGQAVNLGAKCACGEDLLILDCHSCFNTSSVNRLLDTLNRNPDAMVTPAIRHVDFPVCTTSHQGLGYGARFKISKQNTFQWLWLGPERTDKPYPIPLACACAFALKKDTFNKLLEQGDLKQAFNFEEERSMRLWRMGHPTLVEPRSEFGHWFKPHMSDTQQKDWFFSRISSLYVNILQEDNWNKVNEIMSVAWKNDWEKGLEYARQEYSYLRDLMLEYKNNIDESWFIQIE